MAANLNEHVAAKGIVRLLPKGWANTACFAVSFQLSLHRDFTFHELLTPSSRTAIHN
jgi:hypothetical protein